jgi:hypothetical protein
MSELFIAYYFFIGHLLALAIVIAFCRFKRFEFLLDWSMGAIVIGLVPFILMLFLYVFSGGNSLFNDVSQLFIEVLPRLNEKIRLLIYAFGLVLVARVLYARKYKQKIHELYMKYVKKELNHKDQRKITLPKKRFDIQEYITKVTIRSGSFFVGLTQKMEPVYMTLKDIITHLQVSGPSGQGKTASILKPLSIQNMMMGNPTIFIDGKGDAELSCEINDLINNRHSQDEEEATIKEKILNIFKKQSPKKYYITDELRASIKGDFINFNTLNLIENPETENEKKLDVLETSSTFNPLLESADPSILTDMLSKALDMHSESDGDFYFKIQINFLLTMFRLFLSTQKRFTFVDILEFMNYSGARKHVYDLSNEHIQKGAVQDMVTFFEKYKESDLIGLMTTIDQLFVADDTISKLINVYESDLNLKQSLKNKDFVLFSLPVGNRYRSNNALAKMVISIMNNYIGEKEGHIGNKNYWMLVLEEFGQYETDSLNSLITTARNTNTSVLLSYQTESMLSETLSDVVRVNTDSKVIFKTPDDSDFWSKYMGTVSSFKRTDVVEDDIFMTESREGKSSHREVDEFYLHPNVFRNLQKGQSVFKYSPKNTNKGFDAQIVSHEMMENEGTLYKPEHVESSREISGLNLREKRFSGEIKIATKDDKSPKKKIKKKKDKNIDPKEKDGVMDDLHD